MVEIKEKERDKIVGYPSQIKDNKIACKIWDIIKTREVTRTVVKNILYEELFREMSGGKECFEILDELINKGLIKLKQKTTEITVLSI